MCRRKIPDPDTVQTRPPYFGHVVQMTDRPTSSLAFEWDPPGACDLVSGGSEADYCMNDRSATDSDYSEIVTQVSNVG